jgi:hypothetical protein
MLDTGLEACENICNPTECFFLPENSLNAAFEKLDDRKLGYITHEDFLTGKLIKNFP